MEVNNMSTKTEINFVRLLGRCEAMAAEKKFDEWRLEKVIILPIYWIQQSVVDFKNTQNMM